jgi:hypothetical protein
MLNTTLGIETEWFLRTIRALERRGERRHPSNNSEVVMHLLQHGQSFELDSVRE